MNSKLCVTRFWVAVLSLAVVRAAAGEFTSTFPGPNAPSVVTLYGQAAILSGGGLQLNPAAQNSSGAAVLSNLDPGSVVQSFTVSLALTTTNGGGNNPADGWGMYFSAPGVVRVGSYQNYEGLGVGSGIAILVDEFAGGGAPTVSIETGTNRFSLALPSSSILVGNLSVGFSYDPSNGAVLTLTGSNNQQYVVRASEAQLVADGFNLQPGDIFTVGGRVGYPGATSADSHTLDSLTINTVTSPVSYSGAPVIRTQPCNQISRQGDTAWFAVSATNGPPFTYQWLSNGIPIVGATSTIYTTPPVVVGMSGTLYSVIVSNSVGRVTSSNALLRVLPALNRRMVWNDEFNGTTLDANKWTAQNYFRNNGAQNDGYWYPWDVYLSGHGQLVLRCAYDPTNHTYGDGCVASTFQQAYGYWEAKMKFPTQQGHWCAFWNFDWNEGQTNVPGGTNGEEIDIFEKAYLSDHADNALHWNGYGANSGSAGQQVYNMGLNDGGWHIVDLDWTPTNYYFYVDGVLTWATNVGGICQVPNFIYCSDEIGNFGTGPNAWGTGPITNATLPDYTYFEYVRVYDANSPVTILEQPQSTNVKVGGSAGFSVAASGSPPLSYQWQLNGTNISGATATNYLIPDVQLTNAGNYTVVVTNIVGTVTSVVANLSVLCPPELISPSFNTSTNFTFSLKGFAGNNYLVESATNVSSTNWIPITIVSNGTGSLTFTDTNVQACPIRFYRAIVLP